MKFQDAVTVGFDKYVTFSGRALRSECWFWILFINLAAVGTTTVDLHLPMITNATLGLDHMPLLTTVFFLATLLPTYSVTVRRFHDINMRGWWGLLFALPHLMSTPMVTSRLGLTVVWHAAILLAVYGAFIFLLSRKGTEGSNRFGPNPLGPTII